MTDRIRELLAEAVSDVQPRISDPLPTVVRRARRAQLRAFTAGAMAIAVLAGGAVLGGQLLPDRAPAESVGAPAPPPTPRLVDGAIVAGGVTLPVPPGWRVIEQSASAPCGELARTVVISGPDQSGCRLGPLEVSGSIRSTPPGLAGFDAAGNVLPGPAPMVTLAGGEPGWLMSLPKDATAVGDPDYGHNMLLLPWSKVLLVLRGGAAEQQQIIDSIRTNPGPATQLVLPDPVRLAELALWPDGSMRLSHGSIRDPEKIQTLLHLLRQQRTIPENRQACASASDRTARLILHGPSVDLPTPTPPLRVPVNPLSDGAAIVITLAEDCREAVSSRGGRVSLSTETATELLRLFGIPSW